MKSWLYWDGREIAQLTLGRGMMIGREWTWRDKPISFQGGSEQWLKFLTEFLGKPEGENTLKIAAAEIEGVLVVNGAGSATGLRASAAILNALGWAFNWSFVDCSDDDSVGLASAINSEKMRPIFIPKYAQSAKITVPKLAGSEQTKA